MKEKEWYLFVLEVRDTLILLPKVDTHIILTLPTRERSSKMNLVNMSEKCFEFMMQASLLFIQKEARPFNLKILLILSSTKQHSVEVFIDNTPINCQTEKIPKPIIY